MKCPICTTGILAPVTFKGIDVPITQCASCKGIWSDKEKQVLVLGAEIASKLTIPAYAMESSKACPSCKVPLYGFCYSRTEIEISGCKNCQGVWFDHKEIDAIKKTEKDNTHVICPRCNSQNSYNSNDITIASCSSCGVLFKTLFDSRGGALTPAADSQSVEGLSSKGASGAGQTSVKDAASDSFTLSYEWETVRDIETEYKYCIFAIPTMLFIGFMFNVSGFGAQVQRIWLTMPVHEFGHALTAWLTGYNAIPSLWVTRVFSDSRGFFAPVLLFAGILYLIRYARMNNSLTGMTLLVALLCVQFIGTFVISENTAGMLITFGGDGMGLILATLLMSSFYYGKDTNLYKGALRWGFVAIGAAAFVDIYSVWFNSLTDIANVPYGTTGGRYTDSYKLVEHHQWLMDTLINRYFVVGNICLIILSAIYFLGLKKVRTIMAQRDNEQ